VFVSPVDCILSDTTIVQPDVVYLEWARSSLAGARGIGGAPTLAVEIVSPSTGKMSLVMKLSRRVTVGSRPSTAPSAPSR
jgi:Uma2 family endonuclease